MLLFLRNGFSVTRKEYDVKQNLSTLIFPFYELFLEIIPLSAYN